MWRFMIVQNERKEPSTEVNPCVPPCSSQDADDQLLEEIREHELGRRVILIQRMVRGWLNRRKFKKMKAASVVLQKNYRRHQCQKRYQKVSYHDNSTGSTSLGSVFDLIGACDVTCFPVCPR